MPKDPKVNVTVRISPDELAAIDDYASGRSKSRAEVIRQKLWFASFAVREGDEEVSVVVLVPAGTMNAEKVLEVEEYATDLARRQAGGAGRALRGKAKFVRETPIEQVSTEDQVRLHVSGISTDFGLRFYTARTTPSNIYWNVSAAHRAGRSPMTAGIFEFWMTSYVDDSDEMNLKCATFIGKHFAPEKGLNPERVAVWLDRIEPDGQQVYKIEERVR